MIAGGSLAILLWTASGLSMPAAPGPGKPRLANPDFTRGGEIPEGADHDWTLGATGARGWMFSDRLCTTGARQIAITKVADGSPADGALEVGDVILGVAGRRFAFDPRTELGRALTVAESERGRGKLSLIRWRAGRTKTVTLSLPVLGTYSSTAPYDCEKSRAIVELGCRAIASRITDPAYRQNPIPRSLNALALLASGDRAYLPVVRNEVRWAADYSADSFQTWYYGYVLMLLAEYVLATGDDSVTSGLRRLALEAARGQSAVGSWGHRFAGSDGRLLGYGMMNSPGIVLTIGLVLAREAGAAEPEVDVAIDRSTDLVRFYVGKGAVPYGDHRPWIQTHEDNGKCGMAAVLFQLLGEREGAAFFSRMSLASHGPERDTGHTGNFFNMLWSLPGVASSGPAATGGWMHEFGAWSFDLARRFDGTFPYQGPPQEKRDAYRDWDCTGAYLLSYALPLRKTLLTGRRPGVTPRLDADEVESLIADGRGWSNLDRERFYDGLDDAELMRRVGSWSPVVRERAGMALARRPAEDAAKRTKRLITMLDSPDLETRYGACQALKAQRGRAAAAVPGLIKALHDDDLWLRVLAAEALAGIGKEARVAVPELLTRLTAQRADDDPRAMEQRYFSFALFERRDGLIGRSLDGVDRIRLMDAVRAGLRNEDGRARGSIASVYANLSFEELEPLLPAIHQAIVEPSPSGIMFADSIRMAGLSLFAEHRVDDGIELLAFYARHQKPHGSEKRIDRVMDMLLGYGAHARRVLPELEETARYFEEAEPDFPKRLSLDKARRVRETMAAIEASSDRPRLFRRSR